MYVLVCGRIKKGVLFFDSIWQKQKKTEQKTNEQTNAKLGQNIGKKC